MDRGNVLMKNQGNAAQLINWLVQRRRLLSVVSSTENAKIFFSPRGKEKDQH